MKEQIRILTYASVDRKRGVMLAEEQGQEGISSLDVRPGTVEVCIAGFWSSLGMSTHGLCFRYLVMILNLLQDTAL